MMKRKTRNNKPPKTTPQKPDEIARAVKRLGRDGAAYNVGLDGAMIGRRNPDGTIEQLQPFPVVPPQPFDGRGALPPEMRELLDKLDGEPINLDALTSIEGRTESAIPFNFFEAEPPDARQRFRPGDKVATIRPVMGVPVGAIGTVEYLEHPDSVMSSKGRHFYCKFDLTPFKIEFSPNLRKLYEETKAPGMPDMPQYMSFVQTNCGALDLGILEPGENWRPGYKHDYNADTLADIGKALLEMSPAQYGEYLDKVIGHVLDEPTESDLAALDSENRVPGWIDSEWHSPNPKFKDFPMPPAPVITEQPDSEILINGDMITPENWPDGYSPITGEPLAGADGWPREFEYLTKEAFEARRVASYFDPLGTLRQDAQDIADSETEVNQLADPLDALQRAASGEHISPSDYPTGFDYARNETQPNPPKLDLWDNPGVPSTRQLYSQLDADKDLENDGGE